MDIKDEFKKSILEPRYNWLESFGCAAVSTGIIVLLGDVENQPTSTFITFIIVGIAIFLYGYYNIIHDDSDKVEDSNKHK